MRLLEEVEKTTSIQEKLRKDNTKSSELLEKQKEKIKAWYDQIEILTQTIRELSDNQMSKIDETNRIRNVKEKIREVIKQKEKDIVDKKENVKIFTKFWTW